MGSAQSDPSARVLAGAEVPSGGDSEQPPAPAGFGDSLIPEYTGPVIHGPPEVLADLHGDVTRHAAWADAGFSVVDLPGGRNAARTALEGVESRLRSRAEAAGLDFPAAWSLSEFHRIEGLTDALHIKVAKWGVPFRIFGIDPDEVTEFVSQQLGRRMTLFFLHEDPEVENMCGLRVIRPGQKDHNPFHRDGWFDTLRQAVTLWVPLLNCNRGSSLRVYPGSHRWPESDLLRTPSGAQIESRKYRVPALIALRRRVEPIEPADQPGKALLFSSFLLHGGGRNQHRDRTRVSFELRFIAC